MNNLRYALCFAPESGSALTAFADAWFGPATDRVLVPGIAPARQRELTKSARSFGMHGTLKPPFELTPHTSESCLLAVAELIAKGFSPIEVPPLELGEVGFIVSLVPESSSAPPEDLAASCVRACDGYRRPLKESEEKSYAKNRLTVHQKQMLAHWGYPYVMEEFDFHISLTDRILDDTERMAVMMALKSLAAPVLGKPLVMRELAVFREDKDNGAMSIIARMPFGRH